MRNVLGKRLIRSQGLADAGEAFENGTIEQIIRQSQGAQGMGLQNARQSVHHRPDEERVVARSLVVARVLGHTNVIDPDDGPIVWRPDAASVDADGDVEATIERVHFRGVDSDVRLRRPDGTELRFALIDPPPAGSTVRLRIDPTRVIRFD